MASKERKLSSIDKQDAQGFSKRRASNVSLDKGKGRAKELPNDDEESAGQRGPAHVAAYRLGCDDDDVVDDTPETIYDSEEDESLHCSICLSVIDNRTVAQPCGHDAYCFVCILAWTEQSRRCPLCTQATEVLVHNIRSERDFQRHYLPPLPSSSDSPPLRAARSRRSITEGARRQLFERPTHPRFRYADWKARNKPAEMPEVDVEDLALEKRRYIYKHDLYVKHVASNRYTRYRDPSAQQIASSPELKQRLTKWARRELQTFEGVDLEFLAGYLVSIASQLELRSDSSTRLLSEFLGEKDAEHFLHETYNYLRSPYKDIRNYDKAIQYDRPERKAPSSSASLPPPQALASAHGGLDVNQPSRRRKSRSLSRSSADSDQYANRKRSPPRSRTDSSGTRNRRWSARNGDSYVLEYGRRRRESSICTQRTIDNVKKANNGKTSPDNKEPRSCSTQPEKAPSDVKMRSILAAETDEDGGISLGDESGPDLPALPRSTAEESRDRSPPPERTQLSIRGRGQRGSGMASSLILEGKGPSGVLAVSPSAPESSREDSLRSQLAMSIRGLAKSAPPLTASTATKPESAPLVDDSPAQSKRPSEGTQPARRLSAAQADNLRAHLRAAKAGSMTLTSEDNATLRRTIVNSDMKARLMQRLKEEEARMQLRQKRDTRAADLHADESAREAALKHNLLAILEKRRTGLTPQNGAGRTSTSHPTAEVDKQDDQGLKSTKRLFTQKETAPSENYNVGDVDRASKVARLGEMKARMEREKRLNSLKAKLVAEKAALAR